MPRSSRRELGHLRVDFESAEPYGTETPYGRIIADFISGMTDDFFNGQSDKLFVPKSYGMHLEDEN